VSSTEKKTSRGMYCSSLRYAKRIVESIFSSSASCQQDHERGGGGGADRSNTLSSGQQDDSKGFVDVDSIEDDAAGQGADDHIDVIVSAPYRLPLRGDLWTDDEDGMVLRSFHCWPS
jgi:hypothetical protein